MSRRPLILLLALAVPALALAQTPPAPPQLPLNVVSLSASASVDVTRDVLSVAFATSRDGTDAAVVQAQLKAAVDAVLAEARKIARPGQVEVQTGNFALHPRYAPKGGLNGWQGSAEVIVEGKDIAAIAALAGRVQAMPVARVAFSLSREAREKVDADVTALAIARFRQRADFVAQQFGFGAWSIREVAVNTEQPPVGVPMLRMQASRAAADEALPVEAGRASVTASVSGSVQLTPR
jgi:predicted secreted protein